MQKNYVAINVVLNPPFLAQ